MKKSFLYASALVMLLASCSNEDSLDAGVSSGQAGDGNVVKELRLSLASGAGKTRATTPGSGTENNLDNAFVFIKQDPTANESTTSYNYKYTLVELTGKTTTVVKYVEPNSKVFVLANCAFWNASAAQDFLDNDVNAAGVTDQEKVFYEYVSPRIDKTHIYERSSSSGNFMMSGTATVPAANPNGATILAVNVKRDFAKLQFKINQEGEGGNVRIKEVEEVTIRRAAQKVAPFALSGTAETTYALEYGYGDPKYLQDGLKSGVFAPQNDKVTVEGDDISKASDYSFIYQGDKDVTPAAGYWELKKGVYMLPNAANVAEKGTIIVVKAKISTKTTTDGVDSWTEVQGSKYYKARFSAGTTAYATDKNSIYTITATIKGEGNDNPAGPDGPDKEDTESDLNIKVEVQPWNLVISNQTIE